MLPGGLVGISIGRELPVRMARAGKDLDRTRPIEAMVYSRDTARACVPVQETIQGMDRLTCAVRYLVPVLGGGRVFAISTRHAHTGETDAPGRRRATILLRARRRSCPVPA